MMKGGIKMAAIVISFIVGFGLGGIFAIINMED